MSAKPKSHLGENISKERHAEIFGSKKDREGAKEAREDQKEEKATNDGGE